MAGRKKPQSTIVSAKVFTPQPHGPNPMFPCDFGMRLSHMAIREKSEVSKSELFLFLCAHK